VNAPPATVADNVAEFNLEGTPGACFAVDPVFLPYVTTPIRITAVLRGHVMRFLTDHVEAMVQRAALRGRVVTLIHAIVDTAAEILDAAVDLTQALIRDLLRVGARGRRGLRRHHTGGERTEQGARGERADSTGHELSGSHSRFVLLLG